MQILPDVYLVSGGHFFPDHDNCNIYVIDTGESLVLVDVGFEEHLPRVFDYMRRWNLDPDRITHALITHAHLDHAHAAAALSERGIEVAAGAWDAEGIEKADDRMGYYFMHVEEPRPCKVAHHLSDGQALRIGDTTIECIHAPGHTRGSMVYSLRVGGSPPGEYGAPAPAGPAFRARERATCLPGSGHGRLAFFTGDCVLWNSWLAAAGGYGALFTGLGWSGSIDYDFDQYIQTVQRLRTYKPDILLPAHFFPALEKGFYWIDGALNFMLEKKRGIVL